VEAEKRWVLLELLEITEYEGKVMVSGGNFLIIEQLKGRCGSRQLCLGDQADRMFLTIAYNSIDRNNAYVPLASYVKQTLTVSCFTIGVEDLANDCSGF
jgi:hypothetical protein